MKGSLIILVIVLSVIAGAAGGYFGSSLASPSQNALIKEFYVVENAVHVSPHSLRKKNGFWSNKFYSC